jgi:hypothetical protein
MHEGVIREGDTTQYDHAASADPHHRGGEPGVVPARRASNAARGGNPHGSKTIAEGQRHGPRGAKLAPFAREGNRWLFVRTACNRRCLHRRAQSPGSKAKRMGVKPSQLRSSSPCFVEPHPQLLAGVEPRTARVNMKRTSCRAKAESRTSRTHQQACCTSGGDRPVAGVQVLKSGVIAACPPEAPASGGSSVLEAAFTASQGIAQQHPRTALCSSTYLSRSGPAFVCSR